MRRRKLELRPVSAWEAICASREAAGHEESALWRNACMLAKALYKGKKRVFSCGEAVLKAMPAETVACWMKAYTKVCMGYAASWEMEKQALKNDAWGRLRWKVLRLFGGRDLTDADAAYIALQMVLDGEEQLEKLCPQCRSQPLTEACPICGAVQFGENPNFDMSRFEELKELGSSDMGHGITGQ